MEKKLIASGDFGFVDALRKRLADPEQKKLRLQRFEKRIAEAAAADGVTVEEWGRRVMDDLANRAANDEPTAWFVGEDKPKFLEPLVP